MQTQLMIVEEGMLVAEDLLILGTEIAEALLVDVTDMAVKIRPAHTSNITVRIRAVVPQEEDGVLIDCHGRELDAKIILCFDDHIRSEIFVLLIRVEREYNVIRYHLMKIKPTEIIRIVAPK